MAITILDILYSKNLSALDFDWDKLTYRPLLSIISQAQIDYIRSVITDPKLSGKPDKKRELIDQVMRSIGFKRYVEGTNRICYISLDDSRIVMKIAKDRVGMKDSPMEFKNQMVLKPFVCKCFETTPCGTVGLFERVIPVTSIEEFASIADDVFDLIVKYLDGRYVLDDIGSDYFLNYGVRRGFGPVLLDYPYMYDLDGSKLYCNAFDPNSISGRCDGPIDYDAGFNNLLCKKCGKRYLPIELKKEIDNKEIVIKEKGEYKMRVRIMRGNDVAFERYIGEPKKIEYIPAKIEDIPAPPDASNVIIDKYSNVEVKDVPVIEDESISDEDVVVEVLGDEDIKDLIYTKSDFVKFVVSDYEEVVDQKILDEY